MALSKLTPNLESQESDEVREMFCEHCDADGKYALATGYCVNCSDFLCTVCTKYHSKYRQGHFIEDRDHMPHEYCLERCSLHSDKCLKFYCNSCDNFACSKCRENKLHTETCPSHLWKPLHVVVEEINVNELASELEKETDKISDEIKATENLLSQTRRNWQKCIKKARTSINMQRQATERKAVELEKEFLKRIAEIDNSFELNLDLVSKDITDLNSKTGNICSNQSKLRQLPLSCGKFVAVKKMKQEVSPIQDGLQVLKNKLPHTEYEFVPDNDCLAKPEDFGSLLPKAVRRRLTATFVNHIDVKAYFSWIFTSSINDLLSHAGYLIAVCRLSSVIILIDPVQTNVLSRLTVHSAPARAVSIRTDQLAVTLPSVGRIQFYSTHDPSSIKELTYIDVETGCWDIAYSKSKDLLFVSYSEPNGKITCITLEGGVLKSFEKDILEHNLFANPDNIALSVDEGSLFVCDKTRDMVIKLNLQTGKVGAVYKVDDLKSPRGIAVDENGSVFVCGEQSHNIHYLSPDLSKICIIIGPEELREPISVVVNPTLKCLFIGMVKNTKIKRFTIC